MIIGSRLKEERLKREEEEKRKKELEEKLAKLEEEKQKQLDEVLWPTFERVKADIERLGLFEPTIIYGYYPVRSYENYLYPPRRTEL